MKIFMLLMLSILAVQSYADNKYICKSGSAERTIEVVYSNPGSKVPCDVQYTKSDSSEVLWNADNEADYCESKAKEFSDKLTSFGWACSSAADEVVEQQASQ